MIRRYVSYLTVLATRVFLMALVAGCSKPKEPAPAGGAPPMSVPKQETKEHGHKKSERGGFIFHAGDKYHVEAVFEKGGTLRLYTLQQDESTFFEVEAKPLTAHARVAGQEGDAIPFTLKPEPLPGDKEGMTTQFVGELPKELQGKRLDITIIGMRFGNDRVRVPIKNYEEKKHDDEKMPAKVTSQKELALYLTPGGKYTEADIKANGNQTASKKFEGLEAEHDAAPKSGEKICPISKTKANEKFTWIVGGEKYEFCCPPCVDEFLKKAKNAPAEIKSPDDYRQR